VTISVCGGALVARVTDDGGGIGTPAPDGAAGHGLATMRERAEELGGTFEIRSGDAGTSVTATLPLPQVAPAAPGGPS
jgi:signal transduction histidine kinase